MSILKQVLTTKAASPKLMLLTSFLKATKSMRVLLLYYFFPITHFPWCTWLKCSSGIQVPNMESKYRIRKQKQREKSESLFLYSALNSKLVNSVTHNINSFAAMHKNILSEESQNIIFVFWQLAEGLVTFTLWSNYLFYFPFCTCTSLK